MQPKNRPVAWATNRIYTANTPNGVSVIDGETNTLVSRIKVGWSPAGMAINPVNHRVYVANSSDGTISVVEDLPFAVGGIAELPDISSSSGSNYRNLAGLRAAAVVAFIAGVWRIRRRWLI